MDGFDFTNVKQLVAGVVRREGLAGTELSKAQVGTILLELFKVAARVVVSVRRIVLHLSSGYPYRTLLTRLVAQLAETWRHQPVAARIRLVYNSKSLRGGKGVLCADLLRSNSPRTNASKITLNTNSQ